jgi:4-amino-4-deoxy-L-arabinose transferase-like glycosyltransferase
MRIASFAAVLALAGAHVWLQREALYADGVSYDEPHHLTAGFHAWETRRITLNREHPPLHKLLNAAPLRSLGLRLPNTPEPGQGIDINEYSRRFIGENTKPKNQIIPRARWVTVAWTTLLILVAGWFVHPLAAAILAFDPTVLAHGHLITSDTLSALAFLVVVLAWERFLDRRTWGRWLLAAVLLSLAFLAKFSTLLLGPILLTLTLLRPGRRRGLAACAAACASALAIALGVYALFQPPSGLDHPFLIGLRDLKDHARDGHAAYLLGRFSESGWWYYFPVAFAVKTPTATLALFAAAIGLAVWKRLKPPAWIVVPAVFYLAASIGGRLNLGIRHLLPFYPFLAVFIALTVTRALPSWKIRSALLAPLALLLAWELALVRPSYLAFFNQPAGGPEQGARYLLDSNLDWGQGLPALKAWLDANRVTGQICLQYFGTDDVASYRIQERHLPLTWETEAVANVDCVAAIGLSSLHELYMAPGSYRWLRAKRPAARPGHVFAVYDLRSNPQQVP